MRKTLLLAVGCALALVAGAWLVRALVHGEDGGRARSAEAPGSSAAAEETRPGARLQAMEPPPTLQEPEAAPTPVERVAVPAPADPEDGATLVAVVRALGSGRPLAGVPVAVQTEREGVPLEVPADLPAHGRHGELLATDADGRATFALEAGTEVVLRANWAGTFEADDGHVRVPALAPGERREVTLELALGLDSVWYGRVVDGRSGQPLPGVRARPVGKQSLEPRAGAEELACAPDGTVRVEHASWRETSLRFELAGYGPAFVPLDAEHADPARPFVVSLLALAGLDVTVVDGYERPLGDVDVRLSCSAYDLFQGEAWRSFKTPDPRWSARTDATGRAAFAELPADVALTLELFQGERVVGHEERALRLEPGERTAVRRVVGGGCRVRGRTLDDDGVPAPGIEVLLLAGRERFFARRDGDAVQRVTSDASGAFELADVAAGAWLLAPANGRFAASTVPLVVAPDQTEATVDVPCWSRLRITGSVVGPDGEPVTNAYVTALSADFHASESVRDGTFSLGPFPPGRYHLSARAMHGRYGPSEACEAEAGEDGVVLRLRPAAHLRVRVLDPDGAPVSGVMLWVMHEQSEEGSLGMFTDSSGEAAFDNLLAGTCTLSASTALGTFGVRTGVALSPAEDPPPFELRLEPGARLRIRVPDGLERPRIAVLRDGRPIAWVSPGEGNLLSVPPGELEVELGRWGRRGSEPTQVRRVTARLGEETVVDFDAP